MVDKAKRIHHVGWKYLCLPVEYVTGSQCDAVLGVLPVLSQNSFAKLKQDFFLKDR